MSTKINVKKAVGYYAGVKAITEEEAVKLAHVLFVEEYDKWKESKWLNGRHDSLYKKADKLKNGW